MRLRELPCWLIDRPASASCSTTLYRPAHKLAQMSSTTPAQDPTAVGDQTVPQGAAIPSPTQGTDTATALPQGDALEDEHSGDSDRGISSLEELLLLVPRELQDGRVHISLEHEPAGVDGREPHGRIYVCVEGKRPGTGVITRQVSQLYSLNAVMFSTHISPVPAAADTCRCAQDALPRLEWHHTRHPGQI